MLRGWVSHVQNECVSCMVRTSQMNGVFSSLEHCLVTLAQEIWPGFARSFFLVREWIWGRDWSPLCCDSDVHLLSCVCVWVWLNRLEFNSLHLIKYYLKKKLFDGSLSRSSGYRQQGWPTANRKRIFLSFSKQQLLLLKLKAVETRKTMPAW